MTHTEMGQAASAVRKCDGKPATHMRAFLSVVPSLPAEASSRSIDVVASTEAVDRYGRLVVQDWDLANYIENPVVLFNHGEAGGLLGGAVDAELPIGTASNVRVENGELRATVTFADASANPLAEQVYQCFRQGILRAFSVGWDSADVRVEVRDGVEVLVCSQNELLEISACAVPANPEALAHRERLVASLRASSRGGEGPIMTKAIARFLGMAEDATEDVILEPLREVLTLTGEKTMTAALGRIQGLQLAAKAGETAAAELSTLKAAGREVEVTRIVELAKGKGYSPNERAAFLKACGAVEKDDPADPSKKRLLGADPERLGPLVASLSKREGATGMEPANVPVDGSTPAPARVLVASLPAAARKMAKANGIPLEEYARHRAEYLGGAREAHTLTHDEEEG